MSTPRTGGSLLRDGSDCIVMQVLDAPVDLLVTAFLNAASDPVPSIRIDRIGLEDAPQAAPRLPARTLPAARPAAASGSQTAPALVPAATSAAPAKRPIAIPNTGLSVIAHVERTGDMVGHEGKPIGDPATTLRVEGFQLMWPDRPTGVDIAYNIAVEGIGALPPVQTGKFCGTRGQARRITEVTFTLVGPQAGEYQLEGTAYFSGGFQVSLASGTAASGPSGLEHLTALSVRAVKASPATKPAMNPWDDSATTKVFKAADKTPRPVATKKSAARTAKAKQA